MGAVRMNITLPAKTADKLKKKVKARERSKVITEALELYFKTASKKKLVKELIEAYSEANYSNENSLWENTLNDEGSDETW